MRDGIKKPLLIILINTLNQNNMFDDEIEHEYDLTCPACGHSPLHSRDCDVIGCSEGYRDEYDDDPINFPEEGVDLYKCDECKGTGIVRWCPSCGKDLTGHSFPDEEEP